MCVLLHIRTMVAPLSHRWGYIHNSQAQALLCLQLRAASRQNYVPNFKRAFERFLLHTGGRGVIESIQEGLSLSSKDCQASYDTLYRFGNTSAASTWCAHPQS